MSDLLRGTVLITRPEQDSIEIAQVLEERNYQVICESFLKVVFEDVIFPDLNLYDGLIFTSANAVRAMNDQVKNFDIPVVCVGNRTHDEAVCFGFRNVQSAEGTVQDLSCLITSQTPNQSYLYVRGQQVSNDLKALLPDVQIEEIIAYHAEKIDKITDVTRQVMMRGGDEPHSIFL